MVRYTSDTPNGLITPEEHTASFSCYRLPKTNHPAADLVAIRTRLQTRMTTGEVFACFKHEETPAGALRAVNVLEGLPRA